MTVVAFRARAAVTAADTPAVALAQVVMALHALGEPATSLEILRFAADRPGAAGLLSLEAVEQVLENNAGPRSPRAMFRTVRLGARDAWCFTQDFRTWLRHEGYRPHFRRA